jgi:hypothetical protein
MNKDPIGEPGFSVSSYRSSKALRNISMLQRVASFNLYEFVRNQPVSLYDSVGLSAGDPICAWAIEQVEAWVDMVASDPSSAAYQTGLVNAIAFMLSVCGPPPPPSPPPSPSLDPLICPSGVVPTLGWPPPQRSFCERHPVVCRAAAFGAGVAVGALVCTLCPECCLIGVVVGAPVGI